MGLDEYTEQSGQLCWTCQKACGLCPWSEYDPTKKKVRFEPVPGWEATPIHRRNGSSKGVSIMMDTYHITKCPLYIPEEKREEPYRGHAV